ncbi:MAG: flagellar basal-body MS-ring/collar protein FliF [Pseudomonadota bacterium]
MQGLNDFVKALGPSRIAAMGAVALVLFGFFAFLIFRLSQPVYTPLYTDLSFEDSSAILSELDGRGTPYQIRQDGAVILVPKDQVLRLRMDLAQAGLPSGGGVGYEIFDDSSAFGTTSFVQSINHMRALEGELSRTIRALNRVSSARVHLVIPERELFQRDRTEPSASIVVDTRGSLDAGEIRAIRHLVASAVEGLRPGRVSVIDEGGQLLADGTGDQANALPEAVDERRMAIESALMDKVETLVGSIVGLDRVRVKVTADLDMNRITQTDDLFDPEGRVVRSTQTREQTASSSEGGADGVTVANQLPNAGDQDGDAEIRQAENATEEVINYEISRTTRTETLEAGRLSRLSVAVVVDGTYAQDADGDIIYAPRSQDELDRIAALVRSTIGFDEARGDSVEVANLRFAEPPRAIPMPEESGLLEFTRDQYLRISEIGALLLLGLFVILFVARPLVRKVLTPETTATGVAAQAQIEAGEMAEGALPAPESAESTSPPAPPGPAMIEAAQVAGEVHAQSMSRVGEIIDQNPEEAIAIVRAWLEEPARA